MSDYQTLKVLGEYHLALGDTLKAIECFENALNIRVEKFGINHPKTTETQKVLNNLKKRLK